MCQSAIAKTMHDNINLYFFDDDKVVSTIKRMANSVGLVMKMY